MFNINVYFAIQYQVSENSIDVSLLPYLQDMQTIFTLMYTGYHLH